MKHLSELESWKKLQKQAQSHALSTATDLESYDLRSFRHSAHSITLDFSRQRLTENILENLLFLTKERDLKSKIQALMQGDKLNVSENRPALHTALRTPENAIISVNGQNIIPEVVATREKIQYIAEKIRRREWLGFSGKAIADIVNIGMGGSDLGPRFCIKALAEFSDKRLGYHFVSDADPNSFKQTVNGLNPETTLFIISSKSFSSEETLYNARKAVAWLDNPQQMDKHFIAVTAKSDKARQFGINNVLPIWDWVGGRYSMCSAINLITAIAVGFGHFNELLAGAHSMDKHFITSEFSENLPVLLALTGIWNINFLHIHNLLMLSYAQQLEYLVPYIQQLDMESNGKSINMQGMAVNYATGPIIWGGLGNQAQHSYYQSLCQGTHKVAADFISLKSSDDELINDLCEANMRILAEGVHNESNPNGYIPGNTPINHLSLDHCTPFSIGALIALYEHKIFTQSVVWGINPFDQPGVESAKRAFNINRRAEQVISE